MKNPILFTIVIFLLFCFCNKEKLDQKKDSTIQQDTIIPIFIAGSDTIHLQIYSGQILEQQLLKAAQTKKLSIFKCMVRNYFMRHKVTFTTNKMHPPFTSHEESFIVYLYKSRKGKVIKNKYMGYTSYFPIEAFIKWIYEERQMGIFSFPNEDFKKAFYNFYSYSEDEIINNHDFNSKYNVTFSVKEK